MINHRKEPMLASAKAKIRCTENCLTIAHTLKLQVRIVPKHEVQHDFYPENPASNSSSKVLSTVYG